MTAYVRSSLPVFRVGLPALLLAVVALSGCDEVNRDAFGGIKGHVGFPAISDCRVEVYNALHFTGLDATDGLIATGRTNAAGKFSIKLKERYLGRPLIIVARPGPSAMYRDFGAAGTPDVAFDAPRQPWVGMLNEWLGGEDIVSVNPITTVAFHSLMRQPTEQVGHVNLRFDRNNVNAVFNATAANFGIKSLPCAENPAPPDGPMFEEPKYFYLEENSRSTSYTYACLQLAKAANEFVLTTAAPADSALDFYEALFRDAQDGALDGSYFGVPETFLNGVPSVVGRDTDGASLLFRWIATVPLSAAEQGYAGAGKEGKFDPSVPEILAMQDSATGSLRPTRIERFDVSNFPYSGNVEMTIRGQGFRRTDKLLFRNGDDFDTDFVVFRDSVGVDGEFTYHSDTELRVRIPDFAVTTKTVHPDLKVPTNANFRVLRLILRNVPEIDSNKRSIEHVVTRDARMTNRTEPLLVHVEIGRVNASGALEPVDAGNNVYPAATDPDALNPGVDDVYELRVRVANPGPDAIDNVALNFTLSAFSQLGVSVVPEVFTGAPAPGTSLIFSNPLPLIATLNPGGVARLDYRFVFLDTALGTTLAAGAPVKFTPVLEGQSQGAGNPFVSTSDVVGFNRTVELAPVDPAATAVLDPLVAPTLPVSVTAGDSFDLAMDLAASPLSGASMRTLRIDSIDVTITFDGETTELHLADSFFQTFAESGLYATTFTLGTTGGLALPLTLTQVADTASLVLTIRTEAGRTGVLTASFTARATDAATGVASVQTSPAANTNVVP
ncbi:MAG: hypothetical protein IT464_03950 [Planctomycetes bacterium]|nr:hypothetical protein [Planctomycetota bacterium]